MVLDSTRDGVVALSPNDRDAIEAHLTSVATLLCEGDYQFGSLATVLIKKLPSGHMLSCSFVVMDPNKIV